MSEAVRHRVTQLTTLELHRLDAACVPLRSAFGTPYLVGTAASNEGGYRDVDVRCILDDQEFDRLFPNVERWGFLSILVGSYLVVNTGLPIDFQFQRCTEANERFAGRRNPLGLRRHYAAKGDATPFAEREKVMNDKGDE